MPNVASVLKEEIQRLARKEVKAQTGKLRRDVAGMKHDIAAIRRSLVTLERQARHAANIAAEVAAEEDKPVDPKPQTRLGPRSIIALRKKFNLSQGELADLLDVHKNSVLHWEHGRVQPRGASRDQLIEMRDWSASEVKDALAKSQATSKAKAKPKGRKKGRPKKKR